MPNKYYGFDAPVIAGSTIRSDKYNSDQGALQTAFDVVEGDISRSLVLPESFQGSGLIPDKSVENTFVYINADGDLDLYSADVFQTQFADVIIKHSEVVSLHIDVTTIKNDLTDKLAEQADYASIAEEWAIKPEDVFVSNTVDYSSKHHALKSAASAAVAEAAAERAEAASIEGLPAVVSYILSDNGVVFRNNSGADKVLTVYINIGGTESDDYNGYKYLWENGTDTVYVSATGNYLGTTPAGGRYAADGNDPEGLNFRSITLDASDVPDDSYLHLTCTVSNI